MRWTRKQFSKVSYQMLKKSKSVKLPPPPSAPTIDEMLSDVATFQVETEALPRQKANPTDGQQSWWAQFEQFVEGVKDLTVTNTELNSYKLKLESCSVEIATEAKLLKNAIEEQQEKIETIATTGSG